MTKQLLKREKQSRESFSQAVRRIVREQPALTAGELEEAMKVFEGRGAGPKRGRERCTHLGRLITKRSVVRA